MTTTRFPAAYYGKAPGGKGSDLYHILGKTDDFPERATKEFSKLAASVQWTGGGGNKPYSDCFAIWPVGHDAAIVARLRDSGRDRSNRPHTIRVEGAWITRDDIPDWPGGLAGFLDAIAWPEQSPADFSVPLILTADDSESRNGGIRKELAGKKTPCRILLTTHEYFRDNGFEFVQTPDVVRKDMLADQSGAFDSSSHAKRGGHLAHAKPHQVRRAHWMATSVTFLLIFALVAIGLLAAWEFHMHRRVQDQLEATEANLLAARSARKEEKARDDQKIRTLQGDLENTRRELNDFNAILDDFKLKDRDALRRRLLVFQSFRDGPSGNKARLENAELKAFIHQVEEESIREMKESQRRTDALGRLVDRARQLTKSSAREIPKN